MSSTTLAAARSRCLVAAAAVRDAAGARVEAAAAARLDWSGPRRGQFDDALAGIQTASARVEAELATAAAALTGAADCWTMAGTPR